MHYLPLAPTFFAAWPRAEQYDERPAPQRRPLKLPRFRGHPIFLFGREHLFVPACTLPGLSCRAAVKDGRQVDGEACCDVSAALCPGAP